MKLKILRAGTGDVYIRTKYDRVGLATKNRIASSRFELTAIIAFLIAEYVFDILSSTKYKNSLNCSTHTFRIFFLISNSPLQKVPE